MRGDAYDDEADDALSDGLGDEHSPPAWFPGGHLPDDARRMGLTHHVPAGALLDFAGRLDATKPLHRITAWALSSARFRMRAKRKRRRRLRLRISTRSRYRKR